ncbi:MAG: 3-keto-disaccharide hydrolase [Fermentimonas sp.]|jgi:hypothetical protein
MKRFITFCAFCLLFFASTSLYASGYGDNGISRDSLVLFDGTNLDMWYMFIKGRGVNSDPRNVFTIDDSGYLRISGEEWGCITTLDEYSNYRIVLEYKWGEETFSPREDKARDSGLLMHSVGEDGAHGGIWMCSIECNIIEGGTGDFIVVGDGSENFSITSTVASSEKGKPYSPSGNPLTINKGRIDWEHRDPNWLDKKGFRGENDVENPVGEWNLLECVVDGDTITVFLNGQLVNHAYDVKPSRGKIQLQSEGAELFFKRVVLFF